jgi:hypothetical protein
MLASARGAAGCIAAMGMHSGKLPVPLGVQVYQALVRPLLEFASEVWSANEPWPEAEQLQRRIGPRILQAPQRAAGVAVMGELGWQSLEARWQQLRLSFWAKILRMPASSPQRMVYDESLRYHASNAHGSDFVPSAEALEGWTVFRGHARTAVSSLWCAQIQRDLFTTGLTAVWNYPASARNMMQHEWKEKVRIAVSLREQRCWWREVQLHDSLSFFSSIKESFQLQREAYLEVSHGGWNDRVRLGRMALTRLRIASSALRIHTGAWEGLEEALRLCQLCAEAVEDEEHFLLHCTFFQQQRDALFTRIEALLDPPESRPAAATPWSIASESPLTRLLLLTSGRHVRIAAGSWQQRAVLRLVLIELAEWSRVHEAHARRLRTIVES